jgi:hypothetical protein
MIESQAFLIDLDHPWLGPHRKDSTTLPIPAAPPTFICYEDPRHRMEIVCELRLARNATHDHWQARRRGRRVRQDLCGVVRGPKVGKIEPVHASMIVRIDMHDSSWFSRGEQDSDTWRSFSKELWASNSYREGPMRNDCSSSVVYQTGDNSNGQSVVP